MKETKNNLIERYIYAVTRHLSPKIRDDVEKELDGLISDMLEERCGDILPTDKDIKIVLLTVKKVIFSDGIKEGDA